MPGPARLITLNLGSQTFGLAEFRVAHGGLTLLDYRLREVPLDPETGHRRDAHVALDEGAAVLREMMHEMQITYRAVNYALPAQSVFARFVKLPPLDRKNWTKIISFEAQQNVPFPLDEVVWDYQLVGGGLGEQIQVVLVAIKVDLLDQTNAAWKEQDCRRRLSILRRWRSTTPFATAYQRSATARCCWISVRAPRTFFSLNQEEVFLRSIPLGGSAITAAIAREFNESFAAAETQETGRLCGVGRRLCRTCRSQRCAGFENRAQHHDPSARRIDAFRHALPRPTAGKSPGSHFPVWRRCWNAVHARVFSREISSADRVFSIRYKT
jgi:Tfp pilus assembly protein, ATPase PilM